MKVRLIIDAEGESGNLPAGTEIDHPDSHRLCALGFAEPIDDEAKAAHAVYLGQVEKVRKKLAEQSAAMIEEQRIAAEALRQQEERERQAEFEAILREGMS